MARNVFPYIVAAALGSATLLGGSASAADDPSTPPEPCNGITIKDATGDGLVDYFPVVTFAAPGVAREDPDDDIKEIFFTSRTGADGKPKTTVHMVVANVGGEPPAESPQGIVRYYIDFDDIGNLDAVRATNDNGEWTYEYTQWTDTPAGEGTGPSEAVAGTGSVVTGKDGVVSIDLPAQIAAPGTKLEGLFGRITLTSDEEEQIGYNTADLAPDNAGDGGKSYTVTECPAPAAAAPVDTAPVVVAPAVVAATPAPAKPAAKKAKKKLTKQACKKEARKLKGKRRARALKKCAKIRN